GLLLQGRKSLAGGQTLHPAANTAPVDAHQPSLLRDRMPLVDLQQGQPAPIQGSVAHMREFPFQGSTLPRGQMPSVHPAQSSFGKDRQIKGGTLILATCLGTFEDGRTLLIERAIIVYIDLKMDEGFATATKAGVLHIKHGPTRHRFTAMSISPI